MMMDEMLSIEEMADLSYLEEGLNDMLFGAEPSKKGKYHNYEIGKAVIRYNGRNVNVPIECDDRVGGTMKSYLDMFLKNYKNSAWTKSINKVTDKVSDENGKLRCIFMTSDSNPGLYLEYESGGAIKKKTILPGFQMMPIII